MTTETLNEVLILRYLEQAREARAERTSEGQVEVFHFMRCVMLRAGLEGTDAYRTLTNREAELAFSRKESA